MESIAYPGFVEHRAEHDAIRTRIAAMRQRASAGEHTMTLELLQFLTGWIRDHIAAKDHRIALHHRQFTQGDTASRKPPPR